MGKLLPVCFLCIFLSSFSIYHICSGRMVHASVKIHYMTIFGSYTREGRALDVKLSLIRYSDLAFDSREVYLRVLRFSKHCQAKPS